MFTGSLLCAAAGAQQAIALPVLAPGSSAARQSFAFVSDGPRGPGWGRPDEVARVYFDDALPPLFERTLALSGALPHSSRLQWIFTGPHAGVTVELTGSKVRLVQRYYDSTGLGGSGNYPERVVRDDEQQYTGEARSVTVILDAHLSVQVRLNGVEVLRQACVFDLMRHQLQFSAPRTEHLVLAGALAVSPISHTSVRIDANAKHQTMQGFGGSPSIPAYERMSDEGKRRYWALLRRYNLLIDREYPMGFQLKPDLTNDDTLADATPHYYGDNFPNGELSSFAYNKHAQAMGGQVLYEIWALPAWAQDRSGTNGRTTVKLDEYARIMVDYCRKAKERTGSAPAIVGVQNEVDQTPEVFAAMVNVLRRELDKAGFQSVKIQMADASYISGGVARARDLQRFPEAWAKVDYTAAHEYDFQEFLANPDLYDQRLLAMHAASAGKPFLATEICVNDAHYQEPSYRIAFNIGQLYEKNLTELDAGMLLYCWLLLDVEQPTFGGSRSLLVPDRANDYLPVPSSFQLRVLGAYSRHVLRGMVRVDAKSSSPGLLAVAFADAEHSTLILQNRSTEPQSVAVDGAARAWTQLERTSQTQANAVSSSLPAELVVQPGEIVTLSNVTAD